MVTKVDSKFKFISWKPMCNVVTSDDSAVL